MVARGSGQHRLGRMRDAAVGEAVPLRWHVGCGGLASSYEVYGGSYEGCAPFYDMYGYDYGFYYFGAY